MDLTGAAAVVTGAASGLGRATAEALVERGCSVVGLDLAAALEDLSPTPGVTYVAADITHEGDLRAVFDSDAFGDRPLRAVVNCAGIAPSERVLGSRGPHDFRRFARVIEVNLVGTFIVMTAGAAAMAKHAPTADGQRGVVVNTASIAAMDGQIGQAAYAASKAGVAGLTLPAARDLASHGVRVCTVAPGIIDTPMLATVSEENRAALAASVPFPSRLGQPREYAQLVLAIIENNYLNGEVIRLDGALRMAAR